MASRLEGSHGSRAGDSAPTSTDTSSEQKEWRSGAQRRGSPVEFPNTAAGVLGWKPPKDLPTRSRGAQQVAERGGGAHPSRVHWKQVCQESHHHSRQAGRGQVQKRGERYPSPSPSASILCPAFIGVGGQKSSPHDLNIPNAHTFETVYPVTTPPASSGWPREAEVGSCGFWLPRKDSKSKREPT